MVSAMSREHHTVRVAVSGGDLRVGVWESADAQAPTIVAIHGVTSSHLAWEFLAESLPGARVVAPDLRGRGQSNQLVGPAGMAAHADDLAAMFAALELGPSLVVAHSMGAFVAVVLAQRHPELVRRLILVDGGLPLTAPADLSPDELVAAILGPTAARLSMRFDTVGSYLDFWRGHPAFQDDWSPELERYLAYDLVDEGDTSRPATSYATTVEDTVDLNTGATVRNALAALECPTVLVTVPRGLQNETPGLYPPDHLAALLAEYPAIEHEYWPQYNHYTVVLSAEGGRQLAALAQQQLALV